MTTRPSKIRVLFGFRKMSDAELLARSIAVQTGITGNPKFPTAPVDLAALKATNDSFSAAISAALDGGKQAVAEKNRIREVLIKTLRQLGTYVEANFNEDIATLTSAGFQAATPKGPRQNLSPGIRNIEQVNSGQFAVRLAAGDSAASYEFRYAPVVNGTPGNWTTLPVAFVKKPIILNSLTPGTTYAFQVRSLGAAGFTDWSDSVTKMST